MNDDHHHQDDELLQELAQAGAEEDEIARERLDERWDRLSSGELSEQEAAELRALAEESEEGRRAFEAFEPLGEDFYRRVSDQAREALAPAHSPSPEAASEDVLAKEGAEVTPMRRREDPSPVPQTERGFWGRRSFDPIPSAIAAVLVVVVGLGIWWGMQQEALPPYSVEGWTGLAMVRGAETALEDCPTYRSGDTVSVVLRPRTAVTDALGGFLRARCASAPETGDAYSLSPFSEQSLSVNEKGVASLEALIAPKVPGVPSACPAPPGEPEVWVVCFGVVRASGDFDASELCARASVTSEPVAHGKAMVLKTEICVLRE